MKMVLLYIILINMQLVMVKTSNKAPTSAEELQMVVSVPEGFNPPTPPVKPWLYPFENLHVPRVSSTTSNVENADDTDWYPITPTPTLAPTGTAVRQYVNYDSEDSTRHYNHRYDSIPYGPWQPLYTNQVPIKPQTTRDNLNSAKKNDTYVLIGGYRKAQKVNEEQQTKQNISLTTATPLYRELPTTLATTEAVWPGNLEHRSNARQDTLDEESVEYSSSENEDSQANIPINITKLGLPFENNNATDKASICVPLTIEIKHPGKSAEEVERVYCFPLPAKRNDTQSNLTRSDDNSKVYTASNSKVKFNANYMLTILISFIILSS